MQKGAIHVAAQSGAPLVGVSLRSSLHICLNGWDKKQISLPFGRITVVYGQPFYPLESMFDEAAARLGADMDQAVDR